MLNGPDCRWAGRDGALPRIDDIIRIFVLFHRTFFLFVFMDDDKNAYNDDDADIYVTDYNGSDVTSSAAACPDQWVSRSCPAIAKLPATIIGGRWCFDI